MVRYAITSGTSSIAELVAEARRWAKDSVDFVQLREKEMAAGELVRAARAMLAVFREQGPHTKLLVNARADVAVAASADGVHLTSRTGELKPEQVRIVYAASSKTTPLVSISCHSVTDVRRAHEAGANLILFGPVFEKRVEGKIVVAGVGLAALRQACEAAGETPVLALGGVSVENMSGCLETGAAGVAGIRLFKDDILT